MPCSRSRRYSARKKNLSEHRAMLVPIRGNGWTKTRRVFDNVFVLLYFLFMNELPRFAIDPLNPERAERHLPHGPSVYEVGERFPIPRRFEQSPRWQAAAPRLRPEEIQTRVKFDMARAVDAGGGKEAFASVWRFIKKYAKPLTLFVGTAALYGYFFR
jgi:hypothetical protein